MRVGVGVATLVFRGMGRGTGSNYRSWFFRRLPRLPSHGRGSIWHIHRAAGRNDLTDQRLIHVLRSGMVGAISI